MKHSELLGLPTYLDVEAARVVTLFDLYPDAGLGTEFEGHDSAELIEYIQERNPRLDLDGFPETDYVGLAFWLDYVRVTCNA